MKSKLVNLVLAILIISCKLYSQEKPNSIYFEALGNGGLYSVNYDRMFTETIGGRIGFSYIPEIDFIFSSINDLMVIPVMLNYFIGSVNHKLELGAGIAYVSFTSGDFLGFESSSGSSGVTGTATIGYRYQPANGGFLFRIGFTPMFNDEWFQPFDGVSLGFGF